MRRHMAVRLLPKLGFVQDRHQLTNKQPVPLGWGGGLAIDSMDVSLS
jgi:hypothetical protein